MTLDLNPDYIDSEPFFDPEEANKYADYCRDRYKYVSMYSTANDGLVVRHSLALQATRFEDGSFRYGGENFDNLGLLMANLFGGEASDYGY